MEDSKYRVAALEAAISELLDRIGPNVLAEAGRSIRAGLSGQLDRAEKTIRLDALKLVEDAQLRIRVSRSVRQVAEPL